MANRFDRSTKTVAQQPNRNALDSILWTGPFTQ